MLSFPMRGDSCFPAAAEFHIRTSQIELRIQALPTCRTSAQDVSGKYVKHERTITFVALRRLSELHGDVTLRPFQVFSRRVLS